mgnify:CR=1 FL=1
MKVLFATTNPAKVKKYKKALEVTMNAIDYVEPGIHNRIMKAYNEN